MHDVRYVTLLIICAAIFVKASYFPTLRKIICRPTCGNNNDPCTVDTDCCSGSCASNGQCSPPCTAQGQTCHNPNDCCPGQVCGSANKCRACASLFSPCSTNADCCPGLICIGGGEECCIIQ